MCFAEGFLGYFIEEDGNETPEKEFPSAYQACDDF